MVIPRFGLVGQFLRIIYATETNVPHDRSRNSRGFGFAPCRGQRAGGQSSRPFHRNLLRTKPMKIMHQEITNLLTAYEKALNTSDTKAAMALYGSDPIFMAQNATANDAISPEQMKQASSVTVSHDVQSPTAPFAHRAIRIRWT